MSGVCLLLLLGSEVMGRVLGGEGPAVEDWSLLRLLRKCTCSQWRSCALGMAGEGNQHVRRVVKITIVDKLSIAETIADRGGPCIKETRL